MPGLPPPPPCGLSLIGALLTIMQVVPVSTAEESVANQSFIANPCFTVSTQILDQILCTLADLSILRKLQGALK